MDKNLYIAFFYNTVSIYNLSRRNFYECRVHSLSIFSDLGQCAKLLKLPLHKHKQIVQLVLPPESGVILQTGNNPTHYSWWKAAKYNPIPDCQLIKTSC